MADVVNIHEAKTHLSRLLERVRRGGSVVIAKAGRPIARLIPIGEAPTGGLVRETRMLPDARPGSNRTERLQRLMEQEVWPLLPPDQAGRVLSRDEEDAILGHGAHGT